MGISSEYLMEGAREVVRALNLGWMMACQMEIQRAQHWGKKKELLMGTMREHCWDVQMGQLMGKLMAQNLVQMKELLMGTMREHCWDVEMGQLMGK